MNSASSAPAQKVTAGAAADGATTIVMYVLAHVWGITIDPALAVAISLVVGFAVAYFTPPAARDTPVAAPR